MTSRFDEGPANETEDYGGYGPYRQSLRREIYQTYARDLVERDLAYPCFCSEEELQALREQQEQAGEPQKGYFGKWAVWRDQPDERVLEKLQAGEPYVIRLKCDGKLGTFRTFHDELRGDISMQENILDFVIIKRDRTADVPLRPRHRRPPHAHDRRNPRRRVALVAAGTRPDV